MFENLFLTIASAVSSREEALQLRQPAEVVRRGSRLAGLIADDLKGNRDLLDHHVRNANLDCSEGGLQPLAIRNLNDDMQTAFRGVGRLVEAWDARQEADVMREREERDRKYREKLEADRAKEERRKERDAKQAAKAAALAELERLVVPSPIVLIEK